MAWLFLMLAGCCEIGAVLSLKLTDGFKRLKPTISFAVIGMLSFYFLSLALKEIPMGTAYAVWTGIGSAGSVLLGMIFFQESRDRVRLILLSCIIIGVVGLKITQ
ncbi:Quaternary ammonium compound-resistance protein SugE [Bacillus sp. THAF10]|uniref:DMT family transporter n=1 Tax=Bacillus sp. THAF10 TaxID=2587848 RepID=UPI0012682C4D|nr:multidrug efflux SMR transporter [Bacillus sp. THAF10]QFT88206.1 Quaternary ammonium compound-resistance protein SugE [Bacillus sp. THAF10]